MIATALILASYFVLRLLTLHLANLVIDAVVSDPNLDEPESGTHV